MKREDIIFKGKIYEIYKKDSGMVGTYTPLDCLEIIDIAIDELEKWGQNGGLNERDYKEILFEMITRIAKLPKSEISFRTPKELIEHCPNCHTDTLNLPKHKLNCSGEQPAFGDGRIFVCPKCPPPIFHTIEPSNKTEE